MQAIIMRGKAVGTLPEDRATMLFRQISARGWRKSEPVEVPHERPRFVRNLLESQYGAEPHKNKQAVASLALPGAVLLSLAPAPRISRATLTDNAADGSNIIIGDFGRALR